MDIDKIFRSDIHAKIIGFFHENQASIDTPRGVATWIGEERARAKAALEDLVKAKILVAHRAASITGYSYTSDEKLISKIAKLLNPPEEIPGGREPRPLGRRGSSKRKPA